jgi:hypothetical protein
MNRKSGSQGSLERTLKKHKPKRKVSELDEIAAKVGKPVLVHRHGILTSQTAEANAGMSCSASIQTTQRKRVSIFESPERRS